MIKVRMKTTAAGPNVSLFAGKVAVVEDSLGLQLIRGGFAEPIGPLPKEAPEAAVAEPVQERAVKRGPGRPRKQRSSHPSGT